MQWFNDPKIWQSNISKVLTMLCSNDVNYETLACDVTSELLHWPWAEGLYTRKLLQLLYQFIYLKVVSYINLIFLNIPTMVQNFQTLFVNFALVSMSKLVISKPNIIKIDISYLLECKLMCTFQEVRNFILR